MPDEPQVAALRARSPFEAQILIAILKGAGIPVLEKPDLRPDEFAVAQRVMNAAGVEVLVPKERLDDAKRVLAEAREDNEIPEELFEQPEPEPEQARTSVPWPAFVTVVALLAAALFFWFWRQAADDLDAVRGSGLLRWSQPEPGTWRATRKRGGTLAQEQVDRDRNGVPEQVRYFDTSGRLAYAVFDADQDGVYELRVDYNRDGSREEYRDTDLDEVWDECTVFDKSGALVRTEQHRGVDGWVKTR